MTQTIEQLTARVRELEEEKRIAELIAELEHIREQKNLLWFEFSIATQQLAAEQLNNKLLRDALEAVIKVHGYESGIPVEALAQPSDTFALDAYVAEKVKACRELDEKQIAYLFEERNTLTRQRDLAVYGLNEAEVYMTYCKPIEAMREIRKALLAIKESDGK